jgi:hypothetical protein
MKNENTSKSCDTQTETCSTTKNNRLTTVKTVYARAAIVLLALNFCLTGYVVYNMNQTTQDQIDGLTAAGAATSEATTRQTTVTRDTPQTTSQESTAPTTPATTRDQ